MNYILAILGLGAIIIIHELGHFVLAKINGVKVLSFSIGFGPKILTHKGKETEYSISLLPVGGYVEMYGMIDDEEGDEKQEEPKDVDRMFMSKSPLQRLSIIIAGPLMNIVLAIFLFGSSYMNFGYIDTSLGKVTEGGAAIEAGMEAGDRITKVNGNKIFTSDDIGLAVNSSGEKPVTLEYERAGQVKEATLTPKFDEELNRYRIGIEFATVENPTIGQCVKHSFDETFGLITENYKAIVKLISGKGNFKTDLGGPVAIVKVSSSAAKAGVWAMVKLVAILSIGVGIFNLVPLPVLDGGTSVLLLIEMITRRKVPTKVVNVLNTIGVVFLFGLMIIVTIKDILFPIS
ncbi:MAG: site-2 protease family protein [Clostridium sp.]|nr:site-2 protease family protein [Clostridium sp.]